MHNIENEIDKRILAIIDVDAVSCFEKQMNRIDLIDYSALIFISFIIINTCHWKLVISSTI